jgi:hypothetical protein
MSTLRARCEEFRGYTHVDATTARWKRRAAALAVAAGGVALVVWAGVADAHWAERHVLPSYCATGPVGWGVARGARWTAAVLGVLAVVKLAPALARRAPRARVSSPWAIAVSVAAALAVTELYLRVLHRRLASGEPPGAGERGLAMTRSDPRLGWAHHPARVTWAEVGGRWIAYAIDADGDRAASPDARADPARPTLVFAGESIAFGYGLSYEETFAFRVGRELGVQSVNVAVIGYGSDQAHQRVLDALSRYAHPLAVVTVFIPDQIRRNVDDWRPRLGLDRDGSLVPVPPSAGPRILKLLQQLPYHGDEALRVTAAILRATAAAARARGALPLFVVTNYGPPCRPDAADGEAWIVDELFVRQGLAYVRVELGPEDRLPGAFEDHPSARGAEKICAAVARALEQRLGPGLARARAR